jgi:hypothetical protein
VYLMYGDEADAEQGRGQKFFLYGGIFIEQSQAWPVHLRIEELRKHTGFAPQDSLKFASSTKPKTVTADAHRKIKSAVIDLAGELGVIFCTYIFLHAIGRSQEQSDLILYGANTVLSRYNEFLAEKNEHGVAQLDRMGKNGFDYAKEKFQLGLNFGLGRSRRLDRLISVGFTCDGASHLASMADILLGSFRYCVNEPEKGIAGKAMLPKLMPLMWTATRGGKRFVRERGLNLRPKDVRSPDHQQEYEALLNRLQGYLDGSGS